MAEGLFIAGTDTAVGKTHVACGLLRRHAAAGTPWVPFKPFVSGREPDGTYEDIERLRAAAGGTLSDAEISPCRFPPPMAPAAAAEQSGAPVDWAALEARWAALRAGGKPVLVESAGGVRVPLGVRGGKIWTNIELAIWMDLPVLLVARAGLGTINHTVLSVQVLRQAGLRVERVVLNPMGRHEPLAASNAEWIRRMTGVRVEMGD